MILRLLHIVLELISEYREQGCPAASSAKSVLDDPRKLNSSACIAMLLISAVLDSGPEKCKWFVYTSHNVNHILLIRSV